MKYTLTTIGGAFQKGYAFGMMRLAHQAIRSGAFNIVQARQHNDHLGTMAAFLEPLLEEDRGQERRHVIAGFSLGGGMACKLANKLAERGHHVDGVLLVDPVAEPWWLMRGFKKHKVAADVHNVHVYGQENDFPRYDPVWWRGYEQPIRYPGVLTDRDSERHGTIDDRHIEQYLGDVIDMRFIETV